MRCSFSLLFIYIVASIPRESGRQSTILFSTLLARIMPFSKGQNGQPENRVILPISPKILKMRVLLVFNFHTIFV